MRPSLQPDEAIDQFDQEKKKPSVRSKAAVILGIVAFVIEFTVMGLALWVIFTRPPLLQNETFLSIIGLTILIGAALAVIGLGLAIADSFDTENRFFRTVVAIGINSLYLLSVAGLYILGSNT
jgi:tetrahydromethanopterin S-methyltransferase subunit C